MLTAKGVNDLSLGQKNYGGFLTASARIASVMAAALAALATAFAALATVFAALATSAYAQVMPRMWLVHELPKIAAGQHFAYRQPAGAEAPQDTLVFGYGLLSVDARHFRDPKPHGQVKFTTAAFGWRTVPEPRGYDLQLGFDLARWRNLRSRGTSGDGLGETDLSLSPTQRSPLWALDRLRLGIPLKGDFRAAFTDPKANKGFIRSPFGWPSAGWSALQPPMLALELARESLTPPGLSAPTEDENQGRYEGRVWVGHGLGDAANILEGGIAVAGYIGPGLIGYTRGTMSEAKPDRTSLTYKSMVRSDWQAGIVSDGRWPLAYGLYFGLGVGGSSGDTDRPLEATIAGRCYQCFANFQRYQRNIVMGYATYFILARYFIHFEGQDLDQKVGKASTTDHYTYQAIGMLLSGGDLGFASLGFYRGHRHPYPALAPDTLESSRPAFVLRWGIAGLAMTWDR